jgi:hypothetical protein
MSKHKSEEEVIINFFQSAHIERAMAVFNMVKATIKTRTAATAEPAPKPVIHRRKRKANSGSVLPHLPADQAVAVKEA